MEIRTSWSMPAHLVCWDGSMVLIDSMQDFQQKTPRGAMFVPIEAKDAQGRQVYIEAPSEWVAES